MLGALEGQASEAALDVEAGLVDGAVVHARDTLVDVYERPRGRQVMAGPQAAPPPSEPPSGNTETGQV